MYYAVAVSRSEYVFVLTSLKHTVKYYRHINMKQEHKVASDKTIAVGLSLVLTIALMEMEIVTTTHLYQFLLTKELPNFVMHNENMKLPFEYLKLFNPV